MSKSLFTLAITIMLAGALVLTACSQPSGGSGGGSSGSGGSGGTGGSTTTPGGTIDVQGSVIFTKGDGWFEYAFAEWLGVSGASSYKVYYKETTASAYIQVDAALVRPTRSGGTAVGGTYTGDRANLIDGMLYNGTLDGGARVDIPGLKGDTDYQIKVVPVISGSENEAASSVLGVTTLAHDRSGYAFLSSSPAGKTTGGYMIDGTVNPASNIIYVTDATKDTVTLGGVSGLGAIMAAHKTKNSSAPLIVRFVGLVNPPSGVDSLALMNIKETQNVTFEGIGPDALVYGWGLNIVKATNIEVRNLAFHMFPDDSVSIQTDNNNIWVHHNDFMIGADGGGDKYLGDGSCDIKANSNYITVSYNHFRGTGKSSLTGMTSDSAEFFVTWHHNYFDHIGSRGPRIRVGSIHVYNNYYTNVGAYCIGAANGSSVFVQNNYFENSPRPMIIASQGHDYKDLSPGTGAHESIMSSENGGTIKQSGNYMDAYSASWFDASVDTGNAVKGGAVYNNFEADFAKDSYAQTLHTAEFAKEMVLTFAGCLGADNGSVTIPELTSAQKVAMGKVLIAEELSGVYYTDQSETEAAVTAAITAAQANTNWPTLTTAVQTADLMAETVTITIASGSETDTIVVRARTGDEKISDAQVKVQTAISAILYSTASDTLAAVNNAISGLSFYAGVSVTATDSSGDIVITITCAGGTTVTLTIAEPSDAERVSITRTAVLEVIEGLAYGTSVSPSTMLSTVQSALTAASATFSYGTTVNAGLSGDDVVVTISCGTEADTVTVAAPTETARVAATKTVVAAAIASITFVPGETASGVRDEVIAALTPVVQANYAYNTTAVPSESSGDVVISIDCGSASDIITISKPTDSAYVSAARATLAASGLLAWNTDADTTLAAVQAAISSATLNGVAATATISGSTVLVSLSYGTASDSVILASSVTYRFNTSQWASAITSMDSNFFASACTLDSSLSGIITVATEANSKFRAYAVTASLTDGDGTMSFTKAISLRESVSTITVTATTNDLITLVYADANVAPITLSGITTSVEANTFTVSGCSATSYRVSGTGSLILGKNQAARLCAIIVTQYN